MVSRKVFSGNLRAERRTRKVGSGIEFADHRTSARGDDFRYIDWNLYGRLDRMLLRLFEAYTREHEKYCKELEDFCTSRAVPFFRTHTAIPFDELVLRIFRSGGFL